MSLPVRRLVPLLAILATPLAAQPPSPTARLAGLVASARDSTPLEGARVVIVGLDSVRTTDRGGRFDFGRVYPGVMVVQAGAIGYEPRAVKLRIADSSLMEFAVFLQPAAVQKLPELVSLDDKVKKGQFYERLNSGRGRFITRDMIEERAPLAITDMFRGIAGIQMQCQNLLCQINMSRGRGLNLNDIYNCPPAFYLNGVLSDLDMLGTNQIPPTSIEGVEIYRGSAEIPVELNVPNESARCGAIVVWLRAGK